MQQLGEGRAEIDAKLLVDRLRGLGRVLHQQPEQVKRLDHVVHLDGGQLRPGEVVATRALEVDRLARILHEITGQRFRLGLGALFLVDDPLKRILQHLQRVHRRRLPHEGPVFLLGEFEGDVLAAGQREDREFFQTLLPASKSTLLFFLRLFTLPA